MCGIIGSVGKLNHFENIFNGLKRLEYRGYDSSGVSYLLDEKISLVKVTSSIDELKEKVKGFNSLNAIGHTRWATHGKICLENAHPFLSMNQIFSLAHNGTIDNFLELKKELLENGYTFEGETDSEVIVNYLEYLYLKGNEILDCLKILDQKLVGSFSLVIITSKNSNLYFLKNQTGLLISKEKNGYLISSDLYAFNHKNIDYLELDDHQYGFINNKECKVFFDGEKIKNNFKNVTIELEDLNQINCFLEKEIDECPRVVKDELDYYLKNNQININQDIIEHLKNANKIIVIGCGTSYHAGLTFKRFNPNLNVEVKYASEFIYENNIFHDSAVFIVLSQSGETLDIIKSIAKVKSHYILSITNNKDSKIARSANENLDIKAKKEISVASTKAYFCEVLMLYLLSVKLNHLSLDETYLLIDDLKMVLKRKKEIELIAREISKYHSLYFLGKGIDYDAALECSLKLKEITYIHSEAITVGELKHGPLALVNDNFPSIFIFSQPYLEKTINIAKSEIKSRNGKIFEFKLERYHSLSFLSQVLFGDLLSLYVGRFLNVNIDKPRNLAKSVTVE